jgi:hypothetical protein
MTERRLSILSISLAFAGCLSCVAKDPPQQLFDGFEGPTVAEFWLPGSYGSGRYASGAVTVSDRFARTGRRSVQITLHEGDIRQDGGNGKLTERAELDSGAYRLLDSDIFCGFSFLIPRGFPVIDDRLVIAQWKQKGVASPIVAQRYRAGRHYFTIHSPGDSALEYDLPPIDFDRWNDMIYRVRFSGRRDGLVEVWMNGTRVLSWEGTTADAAGRDAFYNKIGLYRDRWREPMTIFFDNYTLGKSLVKVDPSRFDEKSTAERMPMDR